MRTIIYLDGKQEGPYGTLILLCSVGHRMLCRGAGRSRRWEGYPACLKVMVNLLYLWGLSFNISKHKLS
jgi:hypothetical protein